MSEYFDEADVAIAIEEAENKPDRAALIGEVEPVAFIILPEHGPYTLDFDLDGWKPVEEPKPLYTADQLATAHVKGREEGLREALNAIYNIDEPTSYGYEPQYLFPDGISASAAAIERLLGEKP